MAVRVLWPRLEKILCDHTLTAALHEPAAGAAGLGVGIRMCGAGGSIDPQNTEQKATLRTALNNGIGTDISPGGPCFQQVVEGQAREWGARSRLGWCGVVVIAIGDWRV
jgi:hypothetical protein